MDTEMKQSLEGMEGRTDEAMKVGDRLIEAINKMEATVVAEFRKPFAVDADLEYLVERIKRRESRPTGMQS